MTTCYHFFRDCIDEDFDTKNYQNKLDEYAEYAEKKIGQHSEFVAYAYLDDVDSAKKLFQKLGLRAIHAYAIQNDYNDFVFEYEENEVYQQDFED